MGLVKHFEINENGNDYVVGDIHGMYSLLEKKLEEIGFDESVDRLFSVGDLVDRGTESIRVIEWLDKPFFHAVAGNHEQMVVDAYHDPSMAYVLVYNGGSWWLDITEEQQNTIAYLFSNLPLALSIATKQGHVGIVHAEVPYGDWHSIDELKCSPSLASYGLQNVMQWARDKINKQDNSFVKNIHHVYVGHTPLDEKTTLGNVTYLDTGACFNTGKLTVVKL